jgi:hypothetical protein
MRYGMILGLCVLGSACDSAGSRPPTAPSASAAITANQQPGSARPVEVTFTKWITSYPAMAGRTGGAVAGTFEGEVLRRTPFDNGVIVELEARYGVIDPGGHHSFTAIIQGKQNNQTGTAVLNGVVTEGWLVGAQVHVNFNVISPCADGTSNTCFQGTITVMPGSAD